MNIKKTTGLSVYIRPPGSMIWSDNVDSVVIRSKPIPSSSARLAIPEVVDRPC